MALYHHKPTVLTRSKGHSSVASVAYCRGLDLKDERTGITHRYSYKTEVIHRELLLPKDAPQWIVDLAALDKQNPIKASSLLWNGVEKSEKRKDSQLARVIEFALPIELNQEQCILLGREYIKTAYCDMGMVADFSIHWDIGNPHVHCVLSMRSLETNGWGDKVRSWNDRNLNLENRKILADITNRHLKMAGFDKTVSHLSYVDQGIDLEPTIHEGNRNNLANQQARARNKEIRLGNLQKIIDNPEVLLEKLVRESTFFNVQDVTKALMTYIEPANDVSIGPESTPPKPIRLSSRLSRFMTSVAPKFFQESQTQQIGSLEAMLQEVPIPELNIPYNASPQEVITTVLAEITRKESVFNERFLTKVLSQHVANPEAVAQVLAQLKASPELLAIGPGEDGRERFTTRDAFDFENELQELAEQLNQKANHKISGKTINKTIREFKLVDDQAKAIRHILKGSDISIMVGRAGTGKSYSLKAAKAAWESVGYKVYGVAFAGKAADSLENDSGITSRTIDSFCGALKEGKITLTSQDIVVMDEAGMTDNFSMSKIIIAVKEAQAKLVLVGDHAQLQPIGPGAIFRAFIERIGFAELTTIRRQVETWQRQATAHFAAGKTALALEYYEHHHCISLSETPQSAMQTLIQDWADSLKKSPVNENLILAYKNPDVDELNRLARQNLISQGALTNPTFTTNEKGKIEIAKGERILFLENSWSYGVKNGQLATVMDYQCDFDGNVVSIKALLDGKKSKIVEFNPNKYQKFSHGYAVTVHRSQGATIDNSFVFASRGWNRHLSYVAMTRHRTSAKLYSDKENYKSIDKLKKGMAKIGIKDSTLDYPLAFAARRGVDAELIASRFQKHVIEKLKGIKQRLKDNLEQTFNPKQYWARKTEETHKQQFIQETLERREDAKLVATYIDAHCETGMAGRALSEYKKTLGLEINESPKTESDKRHLNNHRTSIALREKTTLRDELAAQIYVEHSRYTQALEFYGIELEKLEEESLAHQARQRVSQYLTELKEERTVHRDKLAAIIQQDMKAHYNALLGSEVCLKILKAHANAHQRRCILIKSSVADCEYFRTVESYTKLSRQSARLWSQIIEQEKAQKISALISVKTIRQMKKHVHPLTEEKFFVDDLTTYEISRLQALVKTGIPISRELLIQARNTVQQRDMLAAEIYQNSARYKMALEFYEFGKPKSISEPPTDFDIKAREWAKEKLERLEKQALQYINKEKNMQLVKDYHVLLNAQNENRYALAAQIINDKKTYYSAIFDLFPEPLALLRTLHKDAKTHQRNELLKTFSESELKAFLKVERYSQENKTINILWHETKDIPTPHHPILKEISHPHIILRDELASAIHAQPELYDKALSFFNIKVESLSKKALAHQVRADLTEFKKRAGDLNARVAIARKIVSNRQAYVVVKEDDTIDWHKLKNYANYALRQERIASLTPSEKEDYYAALKYKRLRREAGKLWAEIFKQKREGQGISDKLFDKAIAINAKRNQLAFNIKDAYERFDAFLFSGRVQTKDIEKHALAYEKAINKQKEIEKIHHSQETSVSIQNPSAQKIEDATRKEAKPYWDVDVVCDALAGNARHFVESLLGTPNQKLSNSTHLRYGKKGSLAVTIAGNKAGLWYDFESREKGNLISLIERRYHYDFKQALQYAAEWAGIAPETKLLKQKSKIKREIYLKSNEFTSKQLEKIEYAKQIIAESIPITGTLAERYLKEHRGISEPIFDKTFRFNPLVKEPSTQKLSPALIVIARNSKDEVQSVQCIYLDPNTANKMDIKVPKRTYGPQNGASALVQEPKYTKEAGYLFALAEGPETALSVAKANKDLGVFVSLGVSNFANVPIPANAKSILLCADNDGINASSQKSLNTAISALAERGLDVYIAKPKDCKDFNDVLLKQGEAEVKRLIDNKALTKKAFTLEQLILEKKTLTSDNAKIIAEFSTWYQAYDKTQNPTSLEKIKVKQQALEHSGELASFIKNNTQLMEIVQRFDIASDVTMADSEYTKQQEIKTQIKAICVEIPSKDFIKDYTVLSQQLDKLTPPWLSKDGAEIAHWRSLNAKAEKLAFVIENTPELKETAQTLPNYNAISIDANSYKGSINKILNRSQDIDMEMGY